VKSGLVETRSDHSGLMHACRSGQDEGLEEEMQQILADVVVMAWPSSKEMLPHHHWACVSSTDWRQE